MSDSCIRDDYAHCFICGGETLPDINLVLYSRKQKNNEKLPYFPFLEFHEPAPNAEPMASDSSIQGCIVCYSYLRTQWNHFVRSKTQISKRLYWLKRPPGCEIRQPVNIIELEEILSEQAREEEEKSDSEDEGISTTLPKKDEDKTKGSKTHSSHGISNTEHQFDMPPKESCCYLCSIPTPKDNMQRIALEKNHHTIKSLPEIPVFSVLGKHKPPRGAVMEGNHITLVCQNCFTDLCRKYPPEEHLATNQHAKEDNANEIKCFICSHELNKNQEAKILYAKQVRKGEPYFPFLNNLNATEEKDIIMPKIYGYTYACHNCFNVLHRQYLSYEKDRVPQVRRKYADQVQSLRGYFSPAKSLPKFTHEMEEPRLIECYICARVLKEKYKVFTHPGGQEDQPFFPAIANIIPATRTQQLNSHAAGGAAFVCKICFENLQNQWKQYEKGGQLPNLNRWLRPYNVQEILCGRCSSTVPTGNTMEVKSSAVSSLDPNAILYDDKVIICMDCESGKDAVMEEQAEQELMRRPLPNNPRLQHSPSSNLMHSAALGSSLLEPGLLSAQLAVQQNQYPFLNPYMNLFPPINPYTAQLAAAALSQQVSQSSLLKAKRALDTSGEDMLSTESKKEKRYDEVMAAKIKELESKYESLKNNSLKLAEAVMKGETAPDKAKNIIQSIEMQ